MRIFRLRSIRYKLLFWFLIIGLLPFVIFLFISLTEAKKAISINIQEDLRLRNLQTANLIEKEFEHLRKQSFLWSSYQIMDDILVGDIDKRIAKFIKKVKINSNLFIEILVLNKSGKIISSTKKEYLFKKFPIGLLTDYKFNPIEFYGQKYLFIFAPIYTSFRNLYIGNLVVLVYPKSLEMFSRTTKGYKFFVYSFQLPTYEPIDVDLELEKLLKNKKGHFLETEEFFIFYKKLSKKIFNADIFSISVVDKEFAFSPINTILHSIIFFGALGTAGIIIFSIIVSKLIINPLEQLTKFANSIAKTKDYSKRIEIPSEDEIQLLANAFNNLLDEIEKVIKELEIESKERLLLFTKLIEFFYNLTETQTKEEAINLLKQNIKSIFGYEVNFANKEESDSYCIDISYKDYRKNKTISEGFLCFKTGKKISQEEKAFLESISKMLSLWFEHISMLETLKELLQKAQASSKAKSIFIANMSHELRTPLNSIIGFSSLLEMAEDLSEEYKDMAKSIRVSSEHLLSLINDILDFAKAEANKIKPRIENVDLQEVFDEIYRIIEPIAKQKNLNVIFPKDLKIELPTDKKLLKQILLNLLSNAVKFTNEGYISISATEDKEKVQITVKDTGIGIAPKDLERIFKDFEQIESPLQKKHKGTGLGLALVKRLVKLLNGEIEVHSEGIGKGSEFVVILPKSQVNSISDSTI
ncbi:MAG: HAMP domain-containing protein [Aquificae bacterium]|nr:HAMP domain-containing protein [Aquificota bacterium]